MGYQCAPKSQLYCCSTPGTLCRRAARASRALTVAPSRTLTRPGGHWHRATVTGGGPGQARTGAGRSGGINSQQLLEVHTVLGRATVPRPGRGRRRRRL